VIVFLLILAGFGGLILGGDYLVRGAVEVAQRLRVSPLVIGLTLVGFGTSMPELVTSVQAALTGSPGIAIGNVVGSNIANILLILGLTALLAPLSVAASVLKRDGAVMIAASLLLVAVILLDALSRAVGVSFLVLLLAYVTSLLIFARSAPVERDIPAPAKSQPTFVSVLAILGGLVLTIISARMLIAGATNLARTFEVSEAVIGLTIVAVGTSLPELVTSMSAARRGQTGLAIGNIIGSNIFNILGILGVTAALKPLSVPARFADADVWVMLGSAILLAVFARSGWRIGRGEGAVLLLLFVCYSFYLVITA